MEYSMSEERITPLETSPGHFDSKGQEAPKEVAKEAKWIEITERTEAPKEGVLASASNGIIKGRWLPGQSGNPSGKPKRFGDITRALEAGINITEAVEGIAALIRDTSSWRAREAGLKLYLSYMYGTPIQRSVTASTKLESILAQVTELSDDEFADVEQKLREG
jgi:hypothetical protein